jgi:hypothetical protein
MATGRVPTTANSPLTAKGDLFGYSTTQARVPVGNDGETIVADSSTSTGLRYTANFAAGKNKIINGDFGIWQRGTSFSPGGYNADRWRYDDSGGATTTISRQTFTPGTAPVAGYEGQYFYRTAVTTAAAYQAFQQYIENVQTFAGQTVTLSFWVKAGASTTISAYLDQNFGSGGSSTVTTTLSTSVPVSTSWNRVSYTVALPSISGKTIGTGSSVGVRIVIGVGTFDYWGFQLEASNTATAFQTATGTIQGELAACQRYYYRAEGANNEALNTANFASTTLANIVITMPVQMRTDPSFNKGANDIIVIYVTSNWTSTNITLDSVSFRSASINVTVSGATLGQAGIAYLRNMANNYLEFSAEL